MNCNQANKKSIVDYLRKKNIIPVKVKGNDYWYLSPFKAEKKASFKVNIVMNRWYNFQDGTGSTLIDLVIRLENCNEKEALRILSNDLFSFHQQVKSSTTENKKKTTIKEVIELSNINLINYIRKRKISLTIAKRYCKEVYYNVDCLTYNAIGFMNNSGGFELRKEKWQGTISPKDVTLIKNNSSMACVFEGFFDFLSYIELTKDTELDFDYLILNSNSNFKFAAKYLINYEHVFYFLDNDDSGSDTFNLALKIGISCTDCSSIYKRSESLDGDLNEYLIEKHNIQPKWFIDQFLHHIKLAEHKKKVNERKERNKGMSR